MVRLKSSSVPRKVGPGKKTDFKSIAARMTLFEITTFLLFLLFQHAQQLNSTLRR
jgi:hypothetical protein